MSGVQAGYDVFLSHNRADAREVADLADVLRGRGLRPWLDRWELVPGADWQHGMADGLRRSSSCAVFLGRADLGSWQRPEVNVALDRAVHDSSFRVFLVLLPGMPEPFDATTIDPFLRMRTWVDLRAGPGAGGDLVGRLVRAVQGLPIEGGGRDGDGPGSCPYRGLLPFGETESQWFFGRDADVQRLLEKLKSSQFLAVLGPSGSGKSSLTMAGLLPALRRGDVPGSQRWSYATLSPGAQPLESLATAVLARRPALRAPELLAELGASDAALSLRVGGGDGGRFVVIVDQTEEVFTLGSDRPTADRFFGNLLHGSMPGGPLTVILTMRADYYGHAATFPALAQTLATHQYLVGPLDRDGLRQVIEQPALAAGLVLGPGLVDVVLNDVVDQPGALPLLEHALLEVWERREGGVLTVDAYAETGGVRGALSARAEEIWGSFTTNEQDAARHLLLRLVQPGEGADATRRPAARTDIATSTISAPELDTVLARLAEARLVTTSTSGPGTVELAHEALIREWPRLAGWIDEDRDDLRTRQRISVAAAEWRQQPSADLLWRGAHLSAAQEWAQEHPGELNAQELAFLDASIGHERAQVRRGKRRAVAALSVIGALLVAGTAVALILFAQARRSADAAEHSLLRSEARRLAAESLGQLQNETDEALLLAVESLAKAETAEGRDALADAVTRRVQSLGPVMSHGSPVAAVAFDADASLLASTAGDGVIRLWDANTRLPAGDLGAAGPAISALAFDPSTRMLAAARDDGVVQLWDVGSGEVVGDLGEAGEPAVVAVAFDPRGGRLASATANGQVQLWDAAPNATPEVLDIEVPDADFQESGVVTLAFSPDGRRLAIGAGMVVIEWDLAAGRLLGSSSGPSEPPRTITGVGYTSFGELTVSESGWEAGDSGLVLQRLPDASTDEWSTLADFSGGVTALAVNGEAMIAAGGDGDVRRPGDQADLNDSGYDPTTVAVSADGSLVVAGTAQGHVLVWDVGPRRGLRERVDDLPAPAGSALSGANAVAVGEQAVVLARDDRIEVLELPSLEARTTILASAHGADFISRLALDRRGEHIAFLTDGPDDQSQDVVVVDARSGSELARRTINAIHAPLSFRPESDELALGGDGSLTLWDWNTDVTTDAPLDAGATIDELAFDATGRMVAVATGTFGDEEGTINVYALEDGAQPDLQDSFSGFAPLAWAPDGSTLASGGDGISVRDVAAGASRAIGPPVRPIGYGIDATSRHLVVATEAGELMVVDLAAGSVIGEQWVAHPIFIDETMGIAMSPDGASVYSVGSYDPQMVEWRLPDAWIEAACAEVGHNLTAAEWSAHFPDEERRRTCDDFE